MLGSMVALEAVDAEASGSNRTLFTVKTAEDRTVYYSKNQGRKDTFPSPPPVASALAHCPNKYILNLGIKNQACHRWSDCNGYVCTCRAQKPVIYRCIQSILDMLGFYADSQIIFETVFWLTNTLFCTPVSLAHF